jgi:hypothetical protein
MLPALRPAVVLALLVAGCHAGGDGSPSQQEPLQAPAVAAQGTLKFADPAASLRFSYPDVGLRVTADHFDPASSPGKFKHEIALSALGTQAVIIDVWNNTEGLSLQDWFEKYLAFTRKAGTVQTGTTTRARLSAFIVDQPRSPQSQPKRIVVFAQAERVFRVTCVDADDATSLHAMQQVLDSFEGQVAP